MNHGLNCANEMANLQTDAISQVMQGDGGQLIATPINQKSPTWLKVPKRSNIGAGECGSCRGLFPQLLLLFVQMNTLIAVFLTVFFYLFWLCFFVFRFFLLPFLFLLLFENLSNDTFKDRSVQECGHCLTFLHSDFHFNLTDFHFDFRLAFSNHFLQRIFL